MAKDFEMGYLLDFYVIELQDFVNQVSFTFTVKEIVSIKEERYQLKYLSSFILKVFCFTHYLTPQLYLRKFPPLQELLP